MSKSAIVERVRALMARAADPGATEEEQRTSAHIAAKLCREHGLYLGDLGEAAAVGFGHPPPPTSRARAEIVIDGVRTVVERFGTTASDVLGFDVFDFARELARERAKEAITTVLRPRKAPRARARARKKP